VIFMFVYIMSIYFVFFVTVPYVVQLWNSEGGVWKLDEFNLFFKLHTS
jgi:hypothetical protein